MKKFITKALICLSISATSTSVLAIDQAYISLAAPVGLSLSSTDNISINQYVMLFAAPVLGASSYTAVTVTIVLLLKQDEIRDLLERAEMENELSSELKSLIQQIKVEFTTKTGVEISEEEVLSQLQAQTI